MQIGGVGSSGRGNSIFDSVFFFNISRDLMFGVFNRGLFKGLQEGRGGILYVVRVGELGWGYFLDQEMVELGFGDLMGVFQVRKRGWVFLVKIWIYSQ